MNDFGSDFPQYFGERTHRYLPHGVRVRAHGLT